MDCGGCAIIKWLIKNKQKRSQIPILFLLGYRENGHKLVRQRPGSGKGLSLTFFNILCGVPMEGEPIPATNRNHPNI